MKDFKFITIEQIIAFNQEINKRENSPYILTNRPALESAVGAAFFPIDNGFLHGTIPEIAAALCYKLAKNHPFLDGNKRTAAVAALVLLELNDFDIVFEEYGDADTEFSRIIIHFIENKTSLDELKNWFIKRTNEKIKNRESELVFI